ncbi:MAG TPA: alpha/beta fold hydrolase [Pyrinomonadaceae bacterium]|nr:alpha/beta fold hydrolase [Pyrinomonadaceae bacterium]
MASPDSKIFRFGRFVLDATERTLLDGEQTVTLAPKVFETLLLLVENDGKVLAKEKMLAEIWSDAFVEENNLAQNISVLRRVLSEDKDNKYIETVPKFGYRFVVPVEGLNEASDRSTHARFHTSEPRLSAGSTAPAREPAHTFAPETKYVQNDGVNIAYQVVGTGKIDIVFVMGWISHLEYFWKHPLFASFLERLASFSRLILFDKRGTGLSDHVPLTELPTLEQRMEDVHAVMNAVASERAVLIGVSEGGPMCSLFAATYPERTAGLVMIGTYAKRIRDADYPWAPTEAQRNAFFDLMTRDWGGPVGIEERAPSMANDPEFREWWAEYLRMGASPGAAVALTRMNAEIDVRDVLPSIRVPTLVIHRVDDACLKVEEGRFVASKIPGSKYVELEGNDHLPFVGDQETILDVIENFAVDLQFTAGHDRVLATVLNIRIADLAAEERKRKAAGWGRFLKQTRAIAAQQLRIFRGREVAYDEDGILATFDGPARAIRCAVSINDAAGKIGVDVKTGLHTGECDVYDHTFAGVAVDLTRRIAGESIGGNILVSRTVKDLVAGSGLKFEEFGIRLFPGIDGAWRLFRVLPKDGIHLP